MLSVNNYKTCISFKSNRKTREQIPGQMSLDLGQFDQFATSTKSRERMADLQLDLQERNNSLEDEVKKSIRNNHKIYKVNNERLNKPRSVNSKIANEEPEKLKKLFYALKVDNNLKKGYQLKKDNKLRIQVLDSIMSKKYPELSGQFNTLSLSKKWQERIQALNKLVNSPNKGINAALFEVLDCLSGGDRLGLDIIDGIVQRFNPEYSGKIRGLRNPYIFIYDKADFLLKLNKDPNSQAEKIQYNLLKFLRPYKIFNNETSEYTGSAELRIQLMNDLTSKYKANPDSDKFKKLSTALLSEYKDTYNPVEVGVSAIAHLNNIAGNNEDINKSVKDFIFSIEKRNGYEKLEKLAKAGKNFLAARSIYLK